MIQKYSSLRMGGHVVIRVNVCKNAVTVRGHAGYAAQGSDIVCAGVSALFRTLVQAIADLTEDSVEYSLVPGKSDLYFGKLSEKSKTLVDSFFIGIAMIAEAYPEHVCITGRCVACSENKI